jgi:hypothetical protein
MAVLSHLQKEKTEPKKSYPQDYYFNLSLRI